MTTMAAPPSAGVLGQAVLHHVDSLDELDAFRRWAGERRDFLAFDTETSDLNTYRCTHRMTQLGDKFHGWAFSPAWMGGAHETMARYQGPMTAFNLPFDWRVLGHRSGLYLPWLQCHDAQLITHLADSSMPTALKPRTAKDIDPAALVGEQKLKAAFRANGWDHATVPDELPQYWAYGAMDAVSTAWLMDKHWPEVSTRWSAAYDLERAYSRLCVQMMDAGLMIDREYIKATIAEFTAWRDIAVAWLGQYGITSPDAAIQVGAALTALGVPDLWRTARTGQVQTDVKAMEHYAATCGAAIPLIGTVQDAKRAGKVISTYLLKMLAMAGADDILHCSIHTIGAQRTSRSSISDPSMQNFSRDIPQVRGGIRPRPGHALVSWDFDQIEMRLAAEFSGDRQLIADFAYCDAHGQSFFLNFAQTIYGPITKKDPRYTTSKNTAYGTVYGSGEETAAATAGVTLDVIKPIYQAWKARYRGLDSWSRRLVNGQKHVKQPHTETWYGRRLLARPGKEYGLVDYKIQGTAAECLKLAALKMEAAGFGSLLRLPVHDELIAEVPIGDAEDVLRAGTAIMSDTTSFKVPLTVSGTIMSERWTKA